MKKRKISSGGAKCFCLMVTLFCCLNSKAQKEMNNWYFGYLAGMGFNSGNPLFQPGAIGASEGSSSISDSAGNLLFYTDGSVVANRNHALMANGLLLSSFSVSSSTQPALIVPQPGNDSIYYIFITPQIEFTATNGLFYAVVNMRKNNNLGAVVQSPVRFYGGVVHEKIAAYKHQNGKDIWILAHEAGNNKFLEYILSDTGLTASPVVIPSGPNTDGFLDRMGYLKFSPDGSKLAMACTGSRLDLFNFNTQSGAISNPVSIPKAPVSCTGFYGVEFSCDSKLLYTSLYYLCSSGNGSTALLQYRTDLPAAADIINSRVVIDSSSNSIYPYAALQAAPDGKIVVAMKGKHFLGCITNPGVYGTGCGFVPQYINIPSPASSSSGLPSFVQGLYNRKPEITAVNNCNDVTVGFNLLHVNPADSVKWDFGDPASGSSNNSVLINPVHTFSSQGFYSVKAIIHKLCSEDTVEKLISVGPGNMLLGPDTALCEGISYTLRAHVPGAAYLWNDNSTADSLVVNASGYYWVKIMSGGCISTDSIYITYHPRPVFSLGVDTSICEGKSLLLDVSGSGDHYLWQNNSTSPSLLITNPGLYWVKVVKNNCSKTDSVNVAISPLPKPSLPGDTTGCSGPGIWLDAGSAGNISTYLWSGGDTGRRIKADKSGLYSVRCFNTCGSVTVQTNVTLVTCDIYFPSAFTPNKDGLNDVFKVCSPVGILEYELFVYNRYGQIVFSTRDPGSGWDGLYKDIKQNIGAYQWFAKIKRLNNERIIMKGSVLLIR